MSSAAPSRTGVRIEPRVVVAAAAVTGFALRAWGAWDDGIFWPDEIYQSFEIAHHLVFGNGLIPWEFVDGARNWSVPGLVAVVLKLCAVVGLDQPHQYIRVVKVLFALLGALTVLGVDRLARAFHAPGWAAAAAATLYALATPAIYFAPRAMAENACTAPLVWGVALLFEVGAAAPARGTATRRTVLLGASLLGLAVLFRLQVAAAVLGVVVALAVLRRFPTLRLALVVLAGWAVVYGVLDAITWHDAPGARALGLFHSAVVYVRFNVIEGKAAQWGVSPPSFYFSVLWSSMPTVTAAMAVGVVAAALRRHWVLLLVGGLFLLVHVASPHKEYRFIVPLIPLACAVVAVGLSLFPARLFTVATAAVVLAGVVSALHLPRLTMGELGAYLDRPASSAWGDFAPVNRLLLEASQQPDLCGLRVDGVDMAWAGGATYLHRDVPLYRPSHPPQLGHFNYVVGPRGYGLPEVAVDEGFALYRLPVQACVPDPSFRWRL